MRPFVPKRLEMVVFAFLVTWLMTFLVAGISTVLAVGPDAPHLVATWFKAWMSSWVVAFPSALIVMPLVRRLVSRIVVD